jgi:hypothetical protein
VSSWAFVPAYRCGAVPDSHRIPFSSSEEEPRNSATIACDQKLYKPIACGYVAMMLESGVPQFPADKKSRQGATSPRCQGHIDDSKAISSFVALSGAYITG